MEKIKSAEILRVIPLFAEMEEPLFEALSKTWSREMVDHLLDLLKNKYEEEIHLLIQKREALLISIDQLTPLALFPRVLGQIREQLKELEKAQHLLQNGIQRALSLSFQMNKESSASFFGNLRLRLAAEQTLLSKRPLEEKLFTFFTLEDTSPVSEGLIRLGCNYESDFKKLGFADVPSGLLKLQELGLSTVKDLRQEEIYSFPLLQEWLLKKRETS